ncbi:tonB dependent receptor family protein (plasmid) [Blastomonas sp. RAC04]|uniref:TonB-dependent receptor n=1 Tax=Blastomonas sp. RAC04 TaxID=1842535 RepID=UPI00083D61C5|nr:TonB-dependent receptor [Blastomonas sp. RAC04]AOF98647.1 tonB dependent receptor family protein [Blastomonas sp. RAC04]
MTNRFVLRCSVALAAISVSAPTLAQEATQGQPETGGLEEIVVTAQRREESLQKVAVAVSAVSGDAIINAGASDAVGLSRLVPSLVIQPAAGTSLSLYLRGVGSQQGNSFAENAIALNVGGVFIARPSSLGGIFYDLERVEVVKGPQGTLYGRNATGGAINVIPRRPILGEFGGNATFEYGNYDSLKLAGALNLPIGENVAVRLATQIVDRDGYLSDGYQDDSGQAVRASILAKPTDGWSILVSADYFHQGGQGIGSVLSPGSAFPVGVSAGYAAPALSRRIGGSDPRSVAALAAFAGTLFAPPFCGGFGGFVRSGCVAPPRADGFVDSDYYGISAEIEGDLGFATLTIVPAYRRSDNKYDGYAPGFLTRTDEVSKQTSLEVRLSSNGSSPFQYVLGGYYFDEDQSALNFFDQGTISTTRFTPNLGTKSYAAFGQGTYSVTDTFRIVAGGRYTKEDRTQLTALASGGLPGVVLPPLGAPFAGDQQFKRFTWKLGVEADIADASLLYANVATGFKAGGFFVASPPNNTFRPEKLTAYTVGSKNRFLNGRIQLNLEGFYWDYTDQQISFVGPVQSGPISVPGGVTINAGRARMFGVDTELRVKVGDHGLFSVDFQYLNAKYKALAYTAISASGGPIRNGCAITNGRQANPGTPIPSRLFDINCSGFPTINSPKFSLNLGYDHEIPVGDLTFVLGARTRIESSRFTNIEYLPEQRQGGYMTSDAYVTLEGPDKRWSLTAFMNNIEDETILGGTVVRPVLQTVYSVLRPPRTYGLRASFNF